MLKKVMFALIAVTMIVFFCNTAKAQDGVKVDAAETVYEQPASEESPAAEGSLTDGVMENSETPDCGNCTTCCNSCCMCNNGYCCHSGYIWKKHGRCCGWKCRRWNGNCDNCCCSCCCSSDCSPGSNDVPVCPSPCEPCEPCVNVSPCEPVCCPTPCCETSCPTSCCSVRTCSVFRCHYRRGHFGRHHGYGCLGCTCCPAFDCNPGCCL